MWKQRRGSKRKGVDEDGNKRKGLGEGKRRKK